MWTAYLGMTDTLGATDGVLFFAYWVPHLSNCAIEYPLTFMALAIEV